MERAKVLTRTGVGLLCLLVSALIVWNIYLYQGIRDIGQDVSGGIMADNKTAENRTQDQAVPVSQDINKPPVVTREGGQTIKKEAEDLRYQLAAAKEELAMVNKELADDAAREAEKKKATEAQVKKFIDYKKKATEYPSQRKIQKNKLDLQYGDLFKKLNLSADKLDQLKDIMVDEDTAMENIAMEYIGTGQAPTKEQQTEENRRFQEIEKEYEAKKADLLGEDNYKVYQSYTETMQERTYVAEFISTLGADEGLTDTQKEDLVEAMNEEVKSVQYEKLDDENASSLSKSEQYAIIMKNLSRQSEAYLKAARAQLSASQFERFETVIKKQLDRMKLVYQNAIMNSDLLDSEAGGSETSK